MRKKNRISFSAVSIDPKRENRSEDKMPEKKKQSKSSTYQYSKFGKKRPVGRQRRPGIEILPKKQTVKVPEIEEGVLRVIPLGGVEQVGQNMTVLEYNNDIIVIDAGIEFSSEDMPGVDFIIPNTKYLEERKEKIRGIFITHGHLDHIGAIPYLIEKLGNPPIYSREFGAIMIQKRNEEFPHLPKLKMNIVHNDDVIRAGKSFVIRSFAISHTIPDSMGLLIETPLGEVAFIEDVRVDNVNGIVEQEEIEQYARFKNRDILLLTMDSTSVEKQGFSLSEQTIAKNIEKIIREVPGRIIIATFASQVERIVTIINFAERYGKKVVIEGRSMKTNVEIAKQLGLIKNKNIIPLEEMDEYPPNKIMMIVTGSQGEEFAALNRIANGTHRQVKLGPSDTVLLSSSIIPDNVRNISKLKDLLYRTNAKIITYLDSDVHASGHGNRGELRWIHQQIKYRFFIPVHGRHYMLKQHAELSQSLGTSRQNIMVPDNGSIIEIYDGGKKIRMRKEKAPCEIVTVDGFAIGDALAVVIKDRQMLSEDGMFVIIALIDQKTGKLKKSPDLISRGFVYLKENQELLRQVRIIIKKSVEEVSTKIHPIDFDYIKNNIGETVSKFLYQKTAKRPLVIPVVLSA
jgi:ribonuclease J